MADKNARDDGASLLWSYRADPPQRYASNYDRYRARGGIIRPNDILRRGLAADPGNGTDMARFYFFCLALDIIAKERLTGDIAELGVYKGGTAAILASFARQLGRIAWLFDTFEGFNPGDLAGIDAGLPVDFRDTSLDAVRAVVGEDNVRYVKGYFPETASALPGDASFCLVHLDCDLYAPMRDALAFFYPRLVPGGFLIVHDYSSLAWNGPERAVDEFLIGKSESIIPLTDGGGSVVIRKARSPDAAAHWLVRKWLAILNESWTPAGGDTLAELLTLGWGGEEDWGRWGVGERHDLLLYLPEPPPGDLILEADVQAALVGSRQAQEIDVLAEGETLTLWRFTRDENRGIRGVRIPATILAAARPSKFGVPFLALSFRPRSVARVMDLEPGNSDDRALGLGLNALRLLPAPV